MYKVAEKRVVEWPVMISEPQDGGKVRKFEAMVQFEYLDRSEFDAIYAGGGTDADMAARVVRGWGDGQFQDAAGQSIAYSDEALARLLQRPNVLAAFAAAYIQMMQGREAARKN
jgi:hypothetical protein